MRAMLRRRTPAGFPRGLCLFAIPEGTRPATFCSSALGTRYFKSDPKRSSLSLSSLLLFLKLANGGSLMYVRRFKNNRYSYEEISRHGFHQGAKPIRNNFPQLLVPVWRFFAACKDLVPLMASRRWNFGPFREVITHASTRAEYYEQL